MKFSAPLALSDVPVNFPGLLHGQQKFVGHAFDFGARDGKRLVNVRDDNRAGQFGVAVHKCLHVRARGGFADAVRHVNGEEIRRRDEPIHRFEPDMVGVHMIGIFPAERLHRRIRFGPQAGRLGADEGVLAVGFVPDRNEDRAQFRRLHARVKLRLALMAKTVAHAKGKFAQPQKWIHRHLIELNKFL